MQKILSWRDVKMLKSRKRNTILKVLLVATLFYLYFVITDCFLPAYSY